MPAVYYFEPLGSGWARLCRFRLPTDGGHAQRLQRKAPMNVSVGSKIMNCRLLLVYTILVILLFIG